MVEVNAKFHPSGGRFLVKDYPKDGDYRRLKERLGHASIATTEKYLHTLPDADDSTLDAFTRIRDRAVVSRPRRRRGR